MARVVVFGATGYAGGRIVAEAATRGHAVVAVARDVTGLAVAPGVTARGGSLLDATFVRDVAQGADVVVSALKAHTADGTGLTEATPVLRAVGEETGVRVGVVGGAGSLLVDDAGTRLMDTPDFPAVAAEEAREHAAVLAALRESPATLDWFYLSPAAAFGSFAPGQRTGEYRLGGDRLLVDEHGESFVGGDDYAIAFVDEIEHPEHRRERFGVAY